jgi:EAL domain-containing protein (putative c-di-GMP-specific phosphodiesterase class I)
MRHRAVDRQALRADLEEAIHDGGIEVAYQPILDLETGKIVGFEALARWEHPQRGAVSPVEFIPMAEEGGVILALGRQVLDQACRQLASWQEPGGRESWRMGVNLSARQLLAPDLVATIRQATEDAGLTPASLTLEISEALLLSDTERVLRRLQRLKDIGVSIAIDDFGTGYSAISYLQRVPFDLLKIDRTFVAALQVEAPGATLVRTIMDLAHTLGRPVIAEGVEQQVELDGLRQLGCEFGQGYLLGPPGDAATVQRGFDDLSETA